LLQRASKNSVANMQNLEKTKKNFNGAIHFVPEGPSFLASMDKYKISEFFDD